MTRPAARELLAKTYAAFNARDVDATLAALHSDVDWPNGMEGGRVHVYVIEDGLIRSMEIKE
jgi:hypothetical protein